MTPRDDIPDARLLPDSSEGFRIEFNPNQPPARVRFSLAHEIGHTIFPDCGSMIRNRVPWTGRGDAWQLEVLCNIAAAEILMPPGPLLDYSEQGSLTIQGLPSIWRKFNVSAEALLIRIARLTREPISVFAASRVNDWRKGHPPSAIFSGLEQEEDNFLLRPLGHSPNGSSFAPDLIWALLK